MPVLVVVDHPKRWPLKQPSAEMVAAEDYLRNPKYSELESAKVFNLCKTYRYQTLGYYVSLLATARGHRPLPSVSTIQDMRQASIVRIVSDDLEDHIQRAFKDLKTGRYTLSVYFGRTLSERYQRLSHLLFSHFPAPFLRAEFRLRDSWRLESLRPIAAGDIPDSHRDFVVAQTERYFARRVSPNRHNHSRYDMAILVNPEEADAPSNERAIQRFIRAGRTLGIRASTVDPEDFGSIAEYDALFIRETTAVNHHTYRFARRADAEGLVVIDDPESIVRCTNKVYQAELFAQHNIPCPKTWVVHRTEAESILNQVSFPCVVKKPDSAFSQGVAKANDPAQLAQHLSVAFEDSELVIVQEFVASEFDWRIGVIANQPLFACRYYFAPGDWRIQISGQSGRRRYGRTETIAIEDAPQAAVSLALDAARPIGNGFYGVDIKQTQDSFVVMEVNDNPSVEAGCEDRVIKDRLYTTVMRVFAERLEARGRIGAL